MKLFDKIDILSFFLFFIIIVFYFFTLLVGFNSYENFKFTSDIFHHFSSIRNIYNGLGPYEGPVQQYFLGRHSYLIFYIISPILFIYNDPKILIIISITSIFISALLINKISNLILKSKLISFFITLLFFIYPIVVKSYFFDPYAFQPDILAIPFFLFLFYSILKNNFFNVTLSCILILIIKEEFILILPALFIFSLIVNYISNLDGIKWDKKKLIFIILIYFFFSFFSLLVLLYFRQFNNYDYLPWELTAINIESIQKIFFVCAKLLAPVIPFFILFTFYKGMTKFSLIVWFLLLSSVFLRVIENIIIYDGRPDGSAWGNFMLAPIIFILIIISAKNILTLKLNYQKIIFGLGFTLIIFFSITNNLLSKQNTFIHYLNFFNKEINYLEFEIESINKKIKYNNKILEFMIMPEYFMYPFMQMSHLSIPSIDHSKSYYDTISKKTNIIKNARYVLINKNELNAKISIKKPSSEFLKLTENNKKKIFESKNFILYE